MLAKKQKQYKLTIGTNDEKTTMEQLDRVAGAIEMIINKKFKYRIHIEDK